MKEVKVEVKDDYLQTLTHVKKPIVSVAELIWNGFDADAAHVEVSLERNGLGAVDSIAVADDGHGIAYEEALNVFAGLGGSWKRDAGRTRTGRRSLHGKRGRGRFRAFSLGRTVRWDTRWQSNGTVSRFQVEGRQESLGTFTVHDPADAGQDAKLGTTVRVTGIDKDFSSLDADKAIPYLTQEFALYLLQYPSVTLVYDRTRIDPMALVEDQTDYPFCLPLNSSEDSETVALTLTVIEWKAELSRGLYLCDESGFALDEAKAGIQAPGFYFSGYLKCSHFASLEQDGELQLDELQPFRDAATKKARELLREHFRQRLAGKASFLVDEWKQQHIYPYDGEPGDPVERSERQVFDIVALNLAEYSPTFDDADNRDKRITFALLRHAVESKPSLVRRVLADFLELPQDKLEELAALLDRTSLSAVITAAKVVADRLDFLRGLEVLLFDAKSKAQLLERRQLHRILAEATWLFGEEYNLTADDENLREVLAKHVSMLGTEGVEFCDPVLREDGREGIVDLVLSRTVKMPDRRHHRHLVVELKRPKVKVGEAELAQTNSYALAVSKDARFDKKRTEWAFVVISDELGDNVRAMAQQPSRPAGLVYDYGEVTVWAKAWSEVINECKARMAFYQERLMLKVDRGTAVQSLGETYAKYLPPSVKAEIAAEADLPVTTEDESGTKEEDDDE